eukprot:COSAG04_NODE_1682_length_5960_cov_43.049480_2_plen_69_part_00
MLGIPPSTAAISGETLVWGPPRRSAPALMSAVAIRTVASAVPAQRPPQTSARTVHWRVSSAPSSSSMR